MVTLESAGRSLADRFIARERLLIALALIAILATVLVLPTMPSTARVPVMAALAAAAAAAFLCGSLGLGFGAILVPALLLLAIEPRVAVASSLMSQVLVMPLGSASHASFGHVRVRIVAPLLATGVLGAFAGAQFAISIPALQLTLLIAATTILMGILVLTRPALETQAEPSENGFLGWAGLLGIGLLAGFAASAFGTGWGPVGVSLLLLVGTAPRLAVGASVTARAPIALSATAAYLLLAGPQQVVAPAVLLPIIAGGIVGVLLGSVVARRLGDSRLRYVIGIAIVVLGLLVFLKV